MYSTGRANLPGSRRERELLGSWARMVGQLLAHSDKPETALLVPAHLRDAHRPRAVERDDAPVERAAGGARPRKRARGGAVGAATGAGPAGLWDEDGGLGGSPPLPPLTATGGGAGSSAFDLSEAEAAEALLAAAGF